LKLQAELLRVVQEKEVRRVGGDRIIPIDVRIIAATNHHFHTLLKNEMFRKDLYYRLAVLKMRVPPLRERTGDVPLLAEYFLSKSGHMNRRVRPMETEHLRMLERYDWPGNVRELENVIEHEMILNRKGPLTFNNLSGDEGRKVASISDLSVKPITFDEMSVHHVTRVLREAKGKVEGANGAAEMLGVNPSTLRSRMKKLGIQYGRKYRN